jgi:excisionase family DNA binding protein
MTLEETIAGLLQTQLAPLIDANRRMAAELERLRQALPAQLVSVPEAARNLGMSPATIRRRIKDGSIPVRRVGRSIRVDLSAVHKGPTEEEIARLSESL